MSQPRHDNQRNCQIIFYLIYGLLLLIYFPLSECSENIHERKSDEFREDLFIRPMTDGKLFAQFQFKTTYRNDIKALRWENNIQLFPLSLVDLISMADLYKLHFSLTKGNWNYDNWGYSTRPSPPGAQIRVQFSPHDEDPERSWGRLVNSLAGKFCASLASADKQTLVASKLSFRHTSSPYNSTEKTFYSNLPEENFCTENLTPWKKLLPCYTKSGLASLLNAANLLKSSYSSLSIDIEPKPCISEGRVIFGCDLVQLTQSIVIIFNPLVLFDGKQTWSLDKIFGNQILTSCPVASHSRIHVDITELDDKKKLFPESYTEKNIQVRVKGNTLEKRTYANFDIHSMIERLNHTRKEKVNLGVKQIKIFKRPTASSRSILPINYRTHLAGVGATDGSIVATIINNFDKPVRVTYMSIVPSFLRIYLHTLTIRTEDGYELEPDRMNFALSKDTTPSLIEFSFSVASMSHTQISYDFERAFLRWTDYKPDANKGVLIGSSLISFQSPTGLEHVVFPIDSVTSNSSKIVFDSNDEGDVFKIYARPLLIILPTPDFSMPYNVICLVSTSIAALFGMVHSLTTRRLVIKSNPQSSKKPRDINTEQDKKDI